MNNKTTILDSVFVISGIIKVKVSVISLILQLRVITLTLVSIKHCVILVFILYYYKKRHPKTEVLTLDSYTVAALL